MTCTLITTDGRRLTFYGHPAAPPKGVKEIIFSRPIALPEGTKWSEVENRELKA